MWIKMKNIVFESTTRGDANVQKQLLFVSSTNFSKPSKVAYVKLEHG